MGGNQQYFDVRDELVRLDKIAKRYHVSQYWI
jgi:hypothetical protein